MVEGKNKACTSVTQKWGKRKKPHQPERIRCINFKKLSKDCSVELISQQKRRSVFDPRSPSKRKKSAIGDFDLEKLARITNGHAAILTCVSPKYKQQFDVSSDLNVVSDVVVETIDVPLSVTDCASTIDKTTNSKAEFKTEFHRRFAVTHEQAENVEKLTRDQSKNTIWSAQRKGRVTASKAKEYTSKVHDNKVHGRVYSSTKSALGYYCSFSNAYVEWGNKKEKPTCDLVVRKLRKSHKKLRCRECGVYISTNFPYISGSPDRILTCTCCGTIPLEVKNPEKAKHMSLTEYLTLPSCCLRNIDGLVSLNRNHDYYFQVQVQMLVTGAKSCIFCVNTWHRDGLFIEQILYDEPFVDEIIAKSKVFFDDVILEELYTNKVWNDMSAIESNGTVQPIASSSSNVECVIPVDSSVAEKSSLYYDQSVDMDTVLAVDVIDVTYTCGICMTECVSDPQVIRDFSIECAACTLWYHTSCVGLAGQQHKINDDSYVWLCEKCRKEI